MSEADTARARRFVSRGVILLVVAAAATIGFIAIALRVVEGHAEPIDREWALAVRRLDNDVLDIVMITFTSIGSTWALYASVGIVSFLAVRRRLWPLAVILVANALAALVTNVALKYSFERERPTLFDEIVRPETFSFPSGHAMSAMGVFGAIAAVLIGLYPRARAAILVGACIVIGGVGLSRVYLGVHWPLDVIAGYAASTPFVAVTVHLVHRLFKRQTHRERAQQDPTPRS